MHYVRTLVGWSNEIDEKWVELGIWDSGNGIWG